MGLRAEYSFEHLPQFLRHRLDQFRSSVKLSRSRLKKLNTPGAIAPAGDEGLMRIDSGIEARLPRRYRYTETVSPGFFVRRISPSAATSLTAFLFLLIYLICSRASSWSVLLTASSAGAGTVRICSDCLLALRRRARLMEARIAIVRTRAITSSDNQVGIW